jgi:ABC transporter substrate binding protein (PQQ-dependent alcohol dehydrogenase system)
VTGFPEAAAQTREFYLASRAVAPVAGSGYRAALWEATLDAYGARELNSRFAGRWGRTMDPTAWAAYNAVKIAFEAYLGTGSAEGTALAEFIAGERGLFDVSKGIGVTFRPWDHQLRQSLFLAKINAEATGQLDLTAMFARASLVGELPAIYMPGTDPVERLDQLGDIEPSRNCT